MDRGATCRAAARPPPGPCRPRGRIASGRWRRCGAERHCRLGERLSPDERERLWITNPLIARWHYRLPEIVRVHAVHARHHRKLIDEIAPGR
ncbi:MAG: hypothetical protein AAB113_11275 [Candidatus Eisenbacteria bacterium]